MLLPIMRNCPELGNTLCAVDMKTNKTASAHKESVVFRARLMSKKINALQDEIFMTQIRTKKEKASQVK